MPRNFTTYALKHGEHGTMREKQRENFNKKITLPAQNGGTPHSRM